MTPYDERKPQEADGDPRTVLEDTAAHERIGMRVDDKKNGYVNQGSTSDWIGKLREQLRRGPR
ncbi:hypothetical protein [Paenibacillus sp.]|uniref:hypothetical protein n=1 Tax=Paenibacillus sp. TaxID=58172 RepID=UPI002D3B291B|nr:hypothetical protein [Paenibacillus sp.]HZG85480.1 hypothetical protein [Paenibacillus sp.]